MEPVISVTEAGASEMQTLNKYKACYYKIICIHLFYLCNKQMIPLFYYCFFVSWEDWFMFLSILLNSGGRYFSLGICFVFVVDPKSSETEEMNCISLVLSGCT